MTSFVPGVSLNDASAIADSKSVGRSLDPVALLPAVHCTAISVRLLFSMTTTRSDSERTISSVGCIAATVRRMPSRRKQLQVILDHVEPLDLRLLSVSLRIVRSGLKTLLRARNVSRCHQAADIGHGLDIGGVLRGIRRRSRGRRRRRLRRGFSGYMRPIRGWS